MTNDAPDVHPAAAPGRRQPTGVRARARTPRAHYSQVRTSRAHYSQARTSRACYSLARISLARCCAGLAAWLSSSVHASLFEGDALDAVADVIAWVALVVGPLVLIVVFWLVHILPEKIAEKRKHPQAKAIQTLCLLSLFFGGLLWPVAWLWAYTKPVLHKMAYGTDVDEHEAHSARATEAAGGDGASDAARARMKVVDSNEDEGAPAETPAGRERA